MSKDVLFVNAGGAKLASVAGTVENLFDGISDTNLRGVYFTSQKALPLLNDAGAVIFTSSFDEFGMAGTSVASATKAAVRSLTRTLASELLPRKIRVNAISPGVITTQIFGKLGVPKEVVEEIGISLQEKIPSNGLALLRRSRRPWPFLRLPMLRTSPASSLPSMVG